MTLPVWAPGLPDVAKYVPRRTIAVAADGVIAPQYGTGSGGTFSPYTHPTDAQVTMIIADACAWVQMAVPDVPDTLTAAALTCAALWAASAVELGFPDNRDDLTTADALYKRATDARTDLETRTGEEPAVFEVVPVYSFPCADPYIDLL